MAFKRVRGWTAGRSLPFLRHPPSPLPRPPPPHTRIPQTKLVLNITNTSYWHEMATTTLFDLIKGYHVLTPNFKFKWTLTPPKSKVSSANWL